MHVFIGPDRDHGDAQTVGQLYQPVAAGLPLLTVAFPRGAVGGVHLEQVSAGIAEQHRAHVGQLPVGRVVHRHQHHRMVLAELGEGLFELLGVAVEVGDDEHQSAGTDALACLVQDARQVVGAMGGIALLGLGGECAEQAPQGAPVLGGAEIVVLAAWVAEEHATHPVVQVVGGPAEQCRGLGRLDRLEGATGAEIHVRPPVHAEQDAALALFAEHLQVGLAGAGGDLPVHIADVVTLVVLAYLLEVESLAAEHRGVEAGEGGVHQVMGGHAQGVGLVAQLQQVVEYGLQAHGDVTPCALSTLGVGREPGLRRGWCMGFREWPPGRADAR